MRSDGQVRQIRKQRAEAEAAAMQQQQRWRKQSSWPSCTDGQTVK